MGRILVHKEEIRKEGAKLQFQIKLPRTDKKVTGLLITATEKALTNGGDPNNSKYAGWIRLRIPEKRDVFYAELVKFSNPIEELLSRMSRLEFGLSENNEWWFGGTKREFFKVDVSIEDTIIEGYYEDHSWNENLLYDLKIYIRTK
ncbi:MAG: hypothetical protein MK086_14240 [Flavobacteriales bacterium]|nr:hypothetical protein [Flavobacteriales bacterium]